VLRRRLAAFFLVAAVALPATFRVASWLIRWGETFNSWPASRTVSR
jgi:hypothetical protein